MPRNPPSGGAAVSSLIDLIDEIRGEAKTGKQLIHAAYLPGSEARWGELDPPLPEPLMGAIRRHGVEQLWSHQTEGIAATQLLEELEEEESDGLFARRRLQRGSTCAAPASRKRSSPASLLPRRRRPAPAKRAYASALHSRIPPQG